MIMVRPACRAGCRAATPGSWICEETRSNRGDRKGHRRGPGVAAGTAGRAIRADLPGVLAARSAAVAVAYVAALLAVTGDRKSCWQLGEQAGHATPGRMQALLAEYAWDWRVVLERLQRFILARLADPGRDPGAGRDRGT